MSNEDNALESLLRRLTSGDPAAASEAFLAYKPYLRMVVARRLSGPARAKFDSEDVIVSAWADLLDGFREGRWQFSDANQLRAFLVTAARNRLLNHLRRHRRELESTRPWPDRGPDTLPAAAQPQPADVAQAGDLWDRMLALCPPAHHELLRLKRQGLTLAELAARTGLHESSVRRILYDLARRLAAPAGGETASGD
jgi:RNA polymerase sigma-70 factor (ECF subfamily)